MAWTDQPILRHDKARRLALGALSPIAFLFEAPAGVLSLPAPRRCQNQSANKHMRSRPERAAAAPFSLAVLIGRDLRAGSRPVMSGIVDIDANDPNRTGPCPSLFYPVECIRSWAWHHRAASTVRCCQRGDRMRRREFSGGWLCLPHSCRRPSACRTNQDLARGAGDLWLRWLDS